MVRNSQYYLYLSHREESSVICTQVNANFRDSTRSFRGKLTRAAFGYFFKSKLSPVSSLPWPMNKINSLKTHFYLVYTICRIDEHVDIKNTPAWYEHLSCSYCYQEDPSKSAVAQKVAHRSHVRCMNRSAHPIGFSCGPIRATWQGVDKVLASIYSVYICVDSRETRTFT